MNCVDDIETIWAVIVILWVVGSRLLKIFKRVSEGKAQGPAQQPISEPNRDGGLGDAGYEDEDQGDATLGSTEPARPGQPPAGRAERLLEDPWRETREVLERRRLLLVGRARDMAGTLIHERANRRFVDVPKLYVPGVLQQASEILVEVGVGDLEHPEVVEQQLDLVEELLAQAQWILEVIGFLAEQRRHPRMAAALGDADRLAEACYRPILTFARAEGLKITSNHPAVALSPFDLQIWTGFIPTSVAPIFLPHDFLERVVWWPSLGHEIGHDFYNSIDGFDQALREDLGLEDREEGVRILHLPEHSLELNEIEGLFGVWLEEIFCDVFDTMMTGPASVASVIDLFAAQHDPTSVASIYVAPEGRAEYDSHPPWHLRLLICTSVLAQMGLHREAVALRKEWDELHQYDDRALDFLVLPTISGQAVLPAEPFEQLARKLAHRLYNGPLNALRGRGLRAVAGLDYGTHRHQEALRARNAFLQGVPPEARDPRAIIAGAVLAARREPDQESGILRLARQAIPAVGTSEHWGETSVASPASGTPLATPLTAEDLLAGVVLHEALARRSSNGQTKSFI